MTTYARFGLQDKTGDLKKPKIEGTVRGLLAQGKSNSKKSDLAWLQTTLAQLPDNEFLMLVGTTAELQQVRGDLNKAGIKEIKGKPGKDLAMWCVRVDADHPDHVARKSTLTVLAIGQAGPGCVFGSKDPELPWQWFGLTKKDASKVVSTKLDKDFDNALDTAKGFKAVNA